MFEYELDSQQNNNEQGRNFDYDYQKEEYINPIIVKGPDGTIAIGTESRSKDIKEALCWNCSAHMLYKVGANKVRCYQCKEINDTKVNNRQANQFIKCPNDQCG